MKHPIRVGLKLSQDASADVMKRVWGIADSAGFDHCWAFDHLASLGPAGPDRPVFDGWTLLGAMAMATTKVRLGLLVTGITYRNPAVLAKLAVTVDHLSGGRLEFGVGAAWAQNEHEMYGIEGLEHRVGRFSEGLQVMKMLWTQERSDFSGRYYTLRDAIANPKPVQKPYAPIWIGAGGPAMLKLTARHADVWNASGAVSATVATAIEGAKQLDEACAAIGRDPGEIRRSVQPRFDRDDVAASIDLLLQFAEAGFTELVVYLGAVDPLRDAEMAAERVLPAVRAAIKG